MTTTMSRRRPPPDPADAALVRRIADGDVAALGELYDRFGTVVHSLTHVVCGGGELVADVVRDVFLDAQHWAASYEPARGPVGAWLLTLTHHRAVAAVRHGAAHPSPADDGSAHHVLDDLDAPDRWALSLAYYGAHTQREVAAILGVPVDEVRSRMAAAVAEVHAALPPRAP